MYHTNTLYHHPGARLPTVRLVGSHNYAELIHRYAFEAPPLLAARLLNTFRDDFFQSAKTIPVAGFPLLDACGRYSLFALADPSFSARQTLREILAHAPRGLYFPDTPVNQEQVEDTMLRLQQTDEDVCKALWVTLATVQLLRLDVMIAPEDPWWAFDWMSGCLPIVPEWKTIRDHIPEPPFQSDDDDVDFGPPSSHA